MSDQWSGDGWSAPEEELRLVLIGRTGSGKSASGNTILGRRHFLTALKASSVTRVCERSGAACEDCGWKKLLVVDMPGFGDTRLDAGQIHAEIAKCVALTAPGPHAFLLVIPLGRYTQDEDRAVDEMVRVFGEDALLHHTVVLFTRGDELQDGGIERFLNDSVPDSLKVLLRRCGGRYHVINNREPEDRAQVRALMQTVGKMLKGSGNTCYTSNMFLQAEQAIRDEQRHISEGRGSPQERAGRWKLRKVSRRQALRSTLSRFRTEAALSEKVLERVKVLVAAGATGVVVGAVFGAVAPLATAAGASVMSGSVGLAVGGAGVGKALTAMVAAASGKTAVALGAATGGVLGGSVGVMAGAESAGAQEAAVEALRQVGAMGAAAVGVAVGVGGAVGAGAAVGAVLEGGAVTNAVTAATPQALGGAGTTARILSAVTEIGRAAVGVVLAGGLVVKVVKERVRSGSGNDYMERNSYEIYWNK